MSEPTVTAPGLRVERDGAVATLLLDRPSRRNALTQQMWGALPGLLSGLPAGEARVLLVRSSTAGLFSAGADIGEYRARAGDVEWGLASQRSVARALGALRELPLPTLAVVDGACVGGGAGIALSCDFRLASTRARFAITPARLGLVFPFEDTAQLVALVGPAAAKRLLLTVELLDAEWAHHVGLVDELTDAADLDANVERWAGALSAVAPGSVRAMKRVVGLVAAGQRFPTAETDRFVVEALAGADHREGVAAFLERRAPRFGPA